VHGYKVGIHLAMITQSCQDAIAFIYNDVEREDLEQAGLPAVAYLGAKMLASLDLLQPRYGAATENRRNALALLRGLARQTGWDPSLTEILPVFEIGILEPELPLARQVRPAAQAELVEAVERCRSKCAISCFHAWLSLPNYISVPSSKLKSPNLSLCRRLTIMAVATAIFLRSSYSPLCAFHRQLYWQVAKAVVCFVANCIPN